MQSEFDAWYSVKTESLDTCDCHWSLSLMVRCDWLKGLTTFRLLPVCWLLWNVDVILSVISIGERDVSRTISSWISAKWLYCCVQYAKMSLVGIAKRPTQGLKWMWIDVFVAVVIPSKFSTSWRLSSSLLLFHVSTQMDVNLRRHGWISSSTY